MDFRVIGERSDLRFDGGKNPRDLFDWTSPIIRREDPKGYGGYGKFAAPLEYIVELVCAQRIGFGRGAKVIFLTVPPVSVKDDADVTRDWMPSDLAFQTTGGVSTWSCSAVADRSTPGAPKPLVG
jgi:hypothetical protein